MQKKHGIVGKIMRSPLVRPALNIPFELFHYAALFCTPKGWQFLQIPHIRNSFFSEDARRGLYHNAILQHDLYIPKESGFSHSQAAPGEWVAYDFHRKREFVGKLMYFDLEEVANNTANMKTPEMLLYIFDYFHCSQATFPTISNLLDASILCETTYQEVFVGASVKQRNALDVLNTSEKKIYQVTPKGNTLIFLEPPTGQHRKHPDYALSPIKV